MSIRWGKSIISFNNFTKFFICINCLQILKSNKISNWILNDSQLISWHWCLSMSPENRKPLALVFWYILGIIEKDQCHVSGECWYSCLFHAFFQLICSGSFNALESYKIFDFKLISRNTFQWPLPVDIYGNQLKQ